MRILFVGDPNSERVAFWLKQLSGTDWDIHLFATSDSNIHPDLKGVTIHDLMYIHGQSWVTPKIPGVSVSGLYWNWVKYLWGFAIGQQIARKMLTWRKPVWIFPVWRLALTIKHIRPDIIHSLGIAQTNYLAMYSSYIPTGRFPLSIVSDIYSEIPLSQAAHVKDEQVKDFLLGTQYFLPKSDNHVGMVKALGFVNHILPTISVLSVTAHQDLAQLRTLRGDLVPSQRKFILVEDWADWQSRPLTAIRALELCADCLQGYRIIICSSSEECRISGHLLSLNTGVPVDVVSRPAGDEHIKLIASARLSVSLKVVNADNDYLLTCMAVGTFTVHSPILYEEEWFTDGKTGLVVPPEDPDIIAVAIKRALTDNELVDNALCLNDQELDTRLKFRSFRAEVIKLYQDIATAHHLSAK